MYSKVATLNNKQVCEFSRIKFVLKGAILPMNPVQITKQAQITDNNRHL